ncbi:VOC family protein [Streptomyces sp. NPDC056672]|uniref:VOC family protein n=1 Tax=Streptomyces sp. NPDC056672 TaxID=3345906 RepID=UPI0036B1B28A
MAARLRHTLTTPGPRTIPRRPGQTVPQQIHLDFTVDDLDEAEALLLRLGAAKPAHQPGAFSGGGQGRPRRIRADG